MTKLERAVEAAQELPEELREEIGENLHAFSVLAEEALFKSQ